MEEAMLVLLVLVLGLRHGLDADHLAVIDGLTRHNWRKGRRVARWVGTCFSFGHGLVVAGVAVILGMVTKNFRFPAYFDMAAVWISIVSLFLIGSLNAYQLLRTRAAGDDFRMQGIKSKFIPRRLLETSNPVLIALIGGLFALSAETVSQTSVWVLASGKSGTYMPLLLGVAFMCGIMLTDTIDSLVTHRMLNQSGKRGRAASRTMGWTIAALAYAVSLSNAFLFFNPGVELNYELLGVLIFVILFVCYVWSIRGRRVKPQAAIDR
ncbi:sodium:proton antiporter [Paenibacillus darwinianus]|uniref:Nickel/cobalt efflux system n=1 Tax=Paenibacillus darwinianus TaxID=1380763 RepID=A0A9W5S270_9BACL|nr:sodium:proton antiporter [Paenibacillus darwinianus]EXX87134.1 sodium:proton antiporter [Paenibacillus darwinianus]EXX88818.1 sodium:proton antiporter [Paenibacillus darwinianus]EXX89699.1 sodium:proton antiporter [Paenibacillus darwinianus]